MMLDRASELEDVSVSLINRSFTDVSPLTTAHHLFISSVDKLFGPITTIQNQKGRVAQKIPWSAFRLDKEDWRQVRDVRDILSVSINHTCTRFQLIDKTYRIRMTFSKHFQQNTNPPLHTPSHVSRIFCLHGRRKKKTLVTNHTTQHSRKGSRN